VSVPVGHNGKHRRLALHQAQRLQSLCENPDLLFSMEQTQVFGLKSGRYGLPVRKEGFRFDRRSGRQASAIQTDLISVLVQNGRLFLTARPSYIHDSSAQGFLVFACDDPECMTKSTMYYIQEIDCVSASMAMRLKRGRWGRGDPQLRQTKVLVDSSCSVSSISQEFSGLRETYQTQRAETTVCSVQWCM
jgi:hypothetical protein